MRCCKDLGIASELWDPRFIMRWKAKYAREVFVEHQVTKKRVKHWLRKGDPIKYPFKESSPGTPINKPSTSAKSTTWIRSTPTTELRGLVWSRGEVSSIDQGGQHPICQRSNSTDKTFPTCGGLSGVHNNGYFQKHASLDWAEASWKYAKQYSQGSSSPRIDKKGQRAIWALVICIMQDIMYKQDKRHSRRMIHRKRIRL